MHDFGAVGGQSETFLSVFRSKHLAQRDTATACVRHSGIRVPSR